MRFCNAPGCAVLVSRGYCAAHAIQHDHGRPGAGTWRKWYHTKRWARLRRSVIVAAAYQCAACQWVTLRIEVDHVRKHNGDPRLFWDPTNLQALCADCHVRKTMRGE